MFILSKQNSIANQFLHELRDQSIQSDKMRFRKNLERIGEILAYEISKTLPHHDITSKTPLAKTTSTCPEIPVLITILRAGIPFYQGFLNYFDQASSGFIGAYRKNESVKMEIGMDYEAIPDITNKVAIIADPMLATGSSILKTIDLILEKGTPQHLHIAAVIAAPEGITNLNNNLKTPYNIWVGALDEQLNQNAYIVPGLGDAGDLAFGNKF